MPDVPAPARGRGGRGAPAAPAPAHARGRGGRGAPAAPAPAPARGRGRARGRRGRG